MPLLHQVGWAFNVKGTFEVANARSPTKKSATERERETGVERCTLKQNRFAKGRGCAGCRPTAALDVPPEGLDCY